MKIIDTMAIIATLDPKHPLYREAIKHLASIPTQKTSMFHQQYCSNAIS